MELAMYNKKGQEVALPNEWKEIPAETQEALLEWYNVREYNVIEDDLTISDLVLLANLYHDGDFSHGTCPECGEKWHYGDPDNWDDFQGVDQREYVGQTCAECYMNAVGVIKRSGVGYIEMNNPIYGD